MAELQAMVGLEGPSFEGPDPVNTAMIRHWCAAIGDRHPAYTQPALAAQTQWHGVIAPPAMLQAWVMPGFGVPPADNDPIAHFHKRSAELGYSSIVATNCEQEYLRPLRLGDRVSVRKRIEAVSDEKRTALGAGIFLTSRFTFTDGDGHEVARMLHRVLKFKPGQSGAAAAAPGDAPAALRPRPNLTHDNAFYFEAARERRLLIQRCTGCGRLRHPPTAACAHCGALGWDTVQSRGLGTLFSYTVIDAPVVPPFKPGHVVGLVELEEGVRVVAELVGLARDEVAIGMPLEVAFLQCDPQLVLPVFRPRADLPVVMLGSERAIAFPGADVQALPRTVSPGDVQVGARLAQLEVPMTRSYIVASAMATRDYQDVHHDPDLARARGSLDVFLNILTTTGLVGRQVTDAFGPNAQLRKLAIKLGATAYPGDTLVIDGQVIEKEAAPSGGVDIKVSIRGTVSRGEHVSGQVSLRLPAAGETA
ncbi:MAG: MaoC family dehydratase N-terminal domain-containing protein [Pseudomonadota bacterium]